MKTAFNLIIWAPKGGAEKNRCICMDLLEADSSEETHLEEYSLEGAKSLKTWRYYFVSINQTEYIRTFNLDQYGEEFKDSPNVGIADLVVAMKWINENIAAFGGDPENVTICGHSWREKYSAFPAERSSTIFPERYRIKWSQIRQVT